MKLCEKTTKMTRTPRKERDLTGVTVVTEEDLERTEGEEVDLLVTFLQLVGWDSCQETLSPSLSININFVVYYVELVVYYKR